MVIVLLWRRWHEVPEVDRVLVCVLSTLPLLNKYRRDLKPPKGDKITVLLSTYGRQVVEFD